MTVQCPKCQAAIVVPVQAVPAAAAAAPIEAQPATAGAAGTGFDLEGSMRAAGLAGLQRTLFFAGVGCLGLLTLFTFVATFSFGAFYAAAFIFFLLTAGVLGFLLFAFFKKNTQLFPISLYVAAGFSAVLALWWLIDLIRFAAIYFSGMHFFLFLLAAGTAGTLGFIAFQKLMKK
ncbi:MAG: hypothetical protein L0Y70_14005 [Gemmataceae bacterium]|nr:hypothetical protein [Gemmataceae bacterium]